MEKKVFRVYPGYDLYWMCSLTGYPYDACKYCKIYENEEVYVEVDPDEDLDKVQEYTWCRVKIKKI